MQANKYNTKKNEEVLLFHKNPIFMIFKMINWDFHLIHLLLV